MGKKNKKEKGEKERERDKVRKAYIQAEYRSIQIFKDICIERERVGGGREGERERKWKRHQERR